MTGSRDPLAECVPHADSPTARYGLAQRLLFALVKWLGKWLLGLTYFTVRITNDSATLSRLNRHPQPSGVYAFWHSHQLSIAWHCRRTRALILISPSRDGEYIARVAASLGYEPVRGSSSRRGAAGMKQLIRRGAEGRTVAITPDGPRGPRHSVGPGGLVIAQKTGYPIVPVAMGLSCFWELPSWDGFRIPKPFSKGYYCWGEPLNVPADADEVLLERLSNEFQRRMIALERYADKMAAGIICDADDIDSKGNG